MGSIRKLSLIDSQFRRKAAICHALCDSGVHVEPFDEAQEIARRWPDAAVVLIEDDADNVSRLMDSMTEAGQWLPVIAFREEPSTRQVAQAIREGAVDYLAWPFGAGEILGAMEAVRDNAAVFGMLKLREARARNRINRLTRREREVLTGVADGLSNRMIGEQLAISPRTVEIHRANMLTKMGAHHTSEAIRIAIEASLVG